MILVDTSVWIDHFRTTDQQLVALLSHNEVLTHPFVVGEIALGSITRRKDVLRYLNNLPIAIVARHDETMRFVEVHKLANTGVGYIDAALLAATALTPNAALWSRDKNLKTSAARCGVAPKIALT